METIWGNVVSIDGRGVLLRGPSGIGKSDLALRLIDAGASLVADDRVEIAREGDSLIALAPEALSGRMEVRGIGIVSVQAVQRVSLVLVIDLVPLEQVPRMPDPGRWTHLGISMPVISLYALEASAAAKVRLAVRQVSTQ
ncbi:HPr kinase/phosphorylase [Thalassobaculum litoreum]|uniref:Hpr(Ser) kinase/phosphatase n=1 Tax=Thalassobaculum litoreum DSM 18839 TaxID=1123362 RepID=A0A8G2F2G1_9PROT|nr:HPr kinase/phosphatase C-terminal domain-containing protein [Thalassobaculum litoreum]SDF52291.1 Hpr(Ser) kinase/phosphatase [Thalassobaculum litoreum DSM 18839]